MAELSIPDQGQRDELARVLAHAFGMHDPQTQVQWFEKAGHDNLRVWADGPVKAGLFYVPMGQFFGGASVPMMGIAGVGVRSDALRQGHATAMMSAALREMAERGYGISTLYASTLSLYRRVGYEPAGSRFIARLRPQDIPIDETGLHPRRMEDSDHGRIKALYDEHAAAMHGHLDRGPYIWPRLLGVRFGVPAHGLLFEDDDGVLQAYVAYRKHQSPGFRSDIEVTDWFATTPLGHRQLWSSLRNQGTMCREITLPSAPCDPAYLTLPDPHFELTLFENFMVRIVDVGVALRSRGYPAHVEATLDLEIIDEHLPNNAGRFQLHATGGRGQLEPGGTGALRLDARGLASLYTGFAHPAVLAQTGRLQGTADALRTAAALFAGPIPWMREMF